MKDKILEIVDRLKFTNKFMPELKKNRELWNWILEQSKVLSADVLDSERIYYALYGKTKTCSKNPENITFVCFAVGYKFCGPAGKCECAKNAVSQRVASQKQTRSRDDIEKENEKRKQTCLEKYNVENLFQDVARIKKGMLEKHGVDNPNKLESARAKIKEKCLELYGTENPAQNKLIQAKIKRTCLEKYGVESAFQNEDVKNKIKQTCIERYGVETPMKNEDVKQRVRQTCLERYGVDNIFKLPGFSQTTKHLYYNQVIGRVKDYLVPCFSIDSYYGVYEEHEWICRTCNTKFSDDMRNGKIPRCPTCFPKNIPIWESELELFLKQHYCGEIIRNTRRIIKPYELDFYLPVLNLAIEMNGLYWHQESNGRDKYYHLNKVNMCEDLGIRLMMFFDDEWDLHKDIILNKCRIATNTFTDKVYGRHCECKAISREESSNFVEKYHLEKPVETHLNYGLFYNNELVSVMTFSNDVEQNSYILTRYCSSKLIVGGASKLFYTFIREYDPVKVITISNKRFSTDNLYNILGFKKEFELEPTFYYIDGSRSDRRFEQSYFEKDKLPTILDFYMEELSEEENLLLNGYGKVWDTGRTVWTWFK